MVIKEPCIITPRLLPGVRIGNDIVSIEYNGVSEDGRQIYKVYIDTPTWSSYFDDLKSGVGGGNLQQGLESALGFLAYAGHSPSDGKDMFHSEKILEWAQQNSDEISSMEYCLDRVPDAIVE